MESKRTTGWWPGLPASTAIIFHRLYTQRVVYPCLLLSAVVFAREALFLRVVRTRSMNNKKAKRREKQTRPHSVMKHHSVIGGKR